jgi:putative glutathione S-transferase
MQHPAPGRLPNLWAFTREICQIPGVAPTVRLEHIKTHYYASHRTINPTGIVPAGPAIDFTQPHDRDARFPARPHHPQDSAP